jgi:hypothetical protein
VSTVLFEKLIVALVVKKFPNLMNSKVHYHIHKSAPTDSVHALPHYALKPHFNMILPSMPDLQIDLLPSGFPTKILYAFVEIAICNKITMKLKV